MTFTHDTIVEVRLCDSRTWDRATVVGPSERVPTMTSVRMLHSGNVFEVSAAQMRAYVAPAPVVEVIEPCGDCGAPSTLDGETMSCCETCAEKRGYDF